MNDYLLSPVQFLITTLFELYILVVMIRFLLQWVRADFYNPVSQFVVKVTNPPLKPLRRVIPGFAGLDISSIILMLILQSISFSILFLLQGREFLPFAIIMLSLAELVSLAINVFLFAIFIQVIVSWINPMAGHNPAMSILYSITEPLLRPARRMLPPISGLDLSPIIVILGLQVLKMLLIPPIKYLAFV